MSAHAPLPPSSADVWVHCAGSAKMQGLYPEPEDSEKSAQGTGAHWGLAELIFGRQIDIGLVAPNGVTIDPEMFEKVGEVFDYLSVRIDEMNPTIWQCETMVRIPRVHADNWGTPDFWAYKPGHLFIADFKYGHEFVEVFENWQLMDYACGIIDQLGLNGHADQSLQIEFVIMQPRSYHHDGPIRTWKTTAAFIRQYFNILTDRAELAMRPDAQVTPGDWCKHCSASHACRALQTSAMQAVDKAAESIPFELDNVQLGYELRAVQRAIAMLQYRENGLVEQGKNAIRSGKVVPFYQLQPSMGRVVWNKPVPEVVAMGQLFNADLKKPDSLITPAQAKALKKIDPSLIDAFSVQPKGEPKFVPIEDIQVRKAFAS